MTPQDAALSTSCQYSKIQMAQKDLLRSCMSAVLHVRGHGPYRWCGFLRAGGSDADGTESAGALAQGTFQTMARAADDMGAVFSDDPPELSSLLLTWALQVRRYFSLHDFLHLHGTCVPSLGTQPGIFTRRRRKGLAVFALAACSRIVSSALLQACISRDSSYARLESPPSD